MKHRILARLVAAALAGASSMVVAAPSDPQAGQQERERSFDIPVLDLAAALEAFGRQSGKAVMFDRKDMEGRRSTAVRGTHPPEAALKRLLDGQGLIMRAANDDTFVIEPSGKRTETSVGGSDPVTMNTSTQSGEPIATLDGVQVFASMEERVSIGGKSEQTLREVPQSVTIVTGERIEAQNLTSLQEVLIQSTGVAVAAFSPLDTFYYSRGIRLQTMQFDGGAPVSNGALGFSYTPDTATIERVELLRGVDGMYSGAGEPGGVINMVRKRPGHYKSIKLDLSTGTWDNYRGVLDVTGPLALDGRLRGRAVASYMDRGYHLDRYTTEKRILYGTLELDATENTLLALGASYEKRNDRGYPAWSGLPRYTDSTLLDLPRSFSTAPPWARWDFETKEVFARVEQKYGETGLLQLKVNHIDQNSEVAHVAIWGAVDPETLEGSTIYGTRADYAPVQRMADLSASGKLELFGRSHSYVLGMDYSELEGMQVNYAMQGFGFADEVPIRYFDYDPYYPEPASSPTSYYPVRKQVQRGLYATVGIQLAEPLRLTLGGRYGKFRYNQALRSLLSGATTYLSYEDEKFIPAAALSYSFSDRWTAYMSYGETFKVQANLLKGPPPGGDPLNPIIGDNLELGIKGDVFQGVTAAASIYRLKRDGQGVVDPVYLGLGQTNPEDGSQCCYIQLGEITVEGMDLEMSGQVLPGWQVFGGYTYTRTDYVGNPTGASTLGRTPTHQLKLWNTYRLPGRFSAVTFNSGVTVQSGTSFGLLGLFPYGGLTLWNASVQYQINDNWSVSLYGDNLTDKVYWQPTGDLNNQNSYGLPRSFTLSLRGRF